MDCLRFLTAGIPLSARPNRSLLNGLSRISELGLDGMELEYVRGLVVDFARMREVGARAAALKLTLTAHAPYYINLNAREKKKIDKSYEYIMDTARLLDCAGGYSMVFHAAYYLGAKPDAVYEAVRHHIDHIASLARKEALKVYIRPELMGKTSQFGTLEEVVRLARDTGFPVAPCVDFAHLHARTGRYNTYDEFARVFASIAESLGEDALKDMHIHYSGIRYTAKGEQKHVIVRDSDGRCREFLKCLKDHDIAGVLVCESPNVEGDALYLKKLYESM